MIWLASLFMRQLPLAWAMALGRAAGWIWYYLVPIRCALAKANVRLAFGKTISPGRRNQIVRASLAHMGMYVVEELRLPDLTKERSEALVTTFGLERIDALLARGQGVIAVTAHVGHFDLLGCSQAVRGYPVHAIVKDIASADGQRFWHAVRSQTRLGQIPPRRSKQLITSLLQENQIVAFLIDQHMPPHRAVIADFFQHEAATTPAPVRFAMATGAPIIPIVIVRHPTLHGHHCIHVEPEFLLEAPYGDVAANVLHNTNRLNRIVERWITTWPEQWLWLHRRWKVQDPSVRALYDTQAKSAEQSVASDVSSPS